MTLLRVHAESIRRARRSVALVLAPVTAIAAPLLVPASAAVAAGAAIAAVSTVAAPAPQAKAATASVLVLLQNGETTAPETTVLQDAGYSVTQVTPSTWQGMSATQFQGYAALVIGDPSSGGTCSTLTPTTGTTGNDALGTNWQSAVTGNIAVLGTAPAAAGSSSANTLITDAAGYAAVGYSSSNSTGTGLYVSLNCEYAAAAAGASVPLLNGVEGIGTAGGLTVQGDLSCSDPGTVNTWEANASGTFGGSFTSALLSVSSWPLPGCPVQEAFDSWPSIFTPVGYDSASDASANFTASDGVKGQPYLLLGAPVSAATQALAPSTGGEVLAGATAGEASNPAAPGVSQATAGDPVNTENGDFTQSSTDVSIPTFGPSLDFTRTYDAMAAQQQTQAGTPGPLGYGWTDNWASSLTQTRPVPGNIYTLDGLETDTGYGGPPTAAALNFPGRVILNGSDTYIVDLAGNRVEEIPGTSKTQWGKAMTAGDIYTVAGADDGASGDSGNGTAASTSLLDEPSSITFDSSGDMIIADTGNCRLAEIPSATSTFWGIPMTAGDLYTIAGRPGQCAVGNDNKAATASDLNAPWQVLMNGSNLYIADSGNNRVQEIAGSGGSQWGQTMTANDVYTIAGSASGSFGSSGDGSGATSALMDFPIGLTVSSAGDLYIADTFNDRVQEVAAATGTQWNISMTQFDIYTVAGQTGQAGVGSDGGAATGSDLDKPWDVQVTNGQNLYIADLMNNRIQEVARTSHTEWGQSMTANDVYTIAGSSAGTGGFSGDGGQSVSALLNQPRSIALDSGNNLLIADTFNNEIREVSASTGVISRVAGGAGTFLQDGDGGPATTAGLNDPYGITSDSHGDIFIADTGGMRVQEIAASSHTQFGITMTAGDVYTVAGQENGTAGIAGDGGPATSAFLDKPTGVAVDSSGNLYIADFLNNRIEEVSASTGNISTFAGSATGSTGNGGDGGPAASARFNGPYAIAVDAAGDVFIADTGNSQIREVPATTGGGMTAGDIYTIAGSTSASVGTSGDGGPATSALLDGPEGVAVDTTGNVYVGDFSNNRVQEIAATSHTQYGQAMTGGDIYTIAGNPGGTSGNTGDGGPASSALLNEPSQLAVDSSGDLYIADGGNNRIREVAAANGTQWGQAMTAGDIYDVAGSSSGTAGTSGDGGPATAALTSDPVGIGTDPSGDLFISGFHDNELREVTATSTPVFPEYPLADGITITQPGGAQVTFYPQTGGQCAAPYQVAGGYCALPQDVTATLTFNSGNQTYSFSPSPGTTYTYGWNGALTGETDAAGNALTITYQSPAPGSGQCPSTATSCNTITSSSGRALVIGLNASGLVTSVTDPAGRTWTYGYAGNDLTSATDPMGNKTTYTYGAGSTGNPALANDLLTITSPNAQPGGPDAGDSTVNTYDTAGQVTTQTDPMGFKTSFGYSGMDPATGNGIVRVSDPDGNATVYDYTQGALAATSDWTGTTLTSEQDQTPSTAAGGATGGTLLDTTSTDGNGNTTSYTYDANGNATSTTAPDGVGSQAGTTTTQYTPLGDDSCDGTDMASTPCSSTQNGPAPVAPGGVITPPSSAPPAGESWTLYDTDGNQLYTTTGVYQPGSNTASYSRTTYQLFKNNTITLNGNNIACTATPPSRSLPCATINADGVVTQLTYNAEGDLKSSSTPDGNPNNELATTTYAYNLDGQQTSATSPDGNLAGANAANYTTVTAYNGDGLKTSETQAGGSGATVPSRTTSYGYDADGNRTTADDARGFTTTTAYNADDEVTLATDPDGNATLTCYDADGNIVQTVPPVGVAANNLSPASCPTSYPSGYSTRLASDATVDSFDSDGNMTKVTTPAPAGQSGFETTTYTYDGNGNLLTTTAPPTSNGGPDQVTVDTYNSADELATQTTGSGTTAASTVSYCYDPDGDQTSVVYADGNTSGAAACNTNSNYPWIVDPHAYPEQAAYQTTYSYDSVGEQVSTTTPATSAAPNGATTSVTYDPAGNKLTSTDPNGVTTTWTYTPPNKPATVSYSGSSAHPVSYGYDANGNTTSMTDGTGSSSYVYDPFDELTSATNGAGQTTGYGYNADGTTASTTYPLPSGATWATTSTVNYTHDNADLLTKVTDFNGNAITIANTADGLPNSVGLGSTGDTIATAYDNTNNPSNITLKNSSSTLQAFSYSDAPAGNIMSETDTPSSSHSPATYSYDAQGRITSMTPGSGTALNYTFDASSNLTTLPDGSSATYDNAGELTSSALSGTTTTYSYDADGQRLKAAQGSTTLASAAWNGAGQLTSYGDAAADMTAATYDGNGLRATATTGTSTQNFTWDTGDGIPQLLMDSNNAYIYADGTAPVEQVDLVTGAITYLVADSLGSIRGTVNSTGSLTATTSYNTWGNPATPGGLTSITPFGFAGGYTDLTGLIYLLARYFQPDTGQFISVDPSVSTTLQPYSYGNDDPIVSADPTGEAPIRGQRCSTNKYRWCDLWVGVSIHKKGDPTDIYQELIVTIRTQPHNSYTVVRYYVALPVNNQSYIAGANLTGYVENNTLNGKFWDNGAKIELKPYSAKFTIKYPNQKGLGVKAIYGLAVYCPQCGGTVNYTDWAHTDWASCFRISNFGDRCEYLHKH